MTWRQVADLIRSRLALRLVYLAAIAAALPLLIWNGAVQQINASLGDVLLRLRGPLHSAATSDIVLLAIDDSTLRNYGPLPLRRSTLGSVIQRLSEYGPRVLAIDMLISEPSRSEEDFALASALSAIPACVLATAMDSDASRASGWIVPLPALARAHAVGHVHAEPDADGNVRSILLAKTGAGKRFWALAVEAARAYLQSGPLIETEDAVTLGSIRIPVQQRADRLMRINYAGPEGTFRRISMASLLDRTAPAELFKGKVVVLGVTAQAGGDRMFTPVSSGIGMSGAEIHANALRTILDRDFLRAPLPASEFAGGFLVATLCVAGIGRLRGMWLFMGLTGLGIAIPVISAVALRFGVV
jgi:CHASE2 domain-containing sensor protein